MKTPEQHPPPATGAPADAAPQHDSNAGWRSPNHSPSMPEVNSTIGVPHAAGFWRKLLAFAGPGLMVAVGYMDPGNWATDIAGGAKFGYTLLSVVLISNLMAMLLQHLALKLGVVSGRDLAQACRDHYSKPTAFTLWVLCEIAIASCDLAEVIGSAIALNLLFGIALVWGVMITALDVLIILFLQQKGFRYIECIVAALIVTIGGCFMYEIIASKPDVFPMLKGLIPTPQIVFNSEKLYIAIAILGATVMPHNLYLHSSIVQTRAYERNDAGKTMAIKFATIDSTISLFFAFFINAAILILAAATFYRHNVVFDKDADLIKEAFDRLSPMLETFNIRWASMLFAVALLASGLNSTLTGTMAGQIVMEGFLNIRLRPWMRRMLTRLVAIIPAAIVAAFYGGTGVVKLLVLSQVILSLQLSFAVVPLVIFTSDKKKMGRFANARWMAALAWVVTAIIVVLNVKLFIEAVAEWLHPAAAAAGAH